MEPLPPTECLKRYLRNAEHRNQPYRDENLYADIGAMAYIAYLEETVTRLHARAVRLACLCGLLGALALGIAVLQ